MPTIGVFHRHFWAQRANGAVAAGAAPPWQYPAVQSVTGARAMAWTGVLPWGLIRWAFARIWFWRIPDRYLVQEALDAEQRAVVDRVIAVMRSPRWADARVRVRACATTPKFHRPEQWTEYSRAVRADGSQAQNIWRHVRIVQELRAADPMLSNPDANLLAEIAYHGFAYGPKTPKARPVDPPPLGVWARLWARRPYAHV